MCVTLEPRQQVRCLEGELEGIEGLELMDGAPGTVWDAHLLLGEIPTQCRFSTKRSVNRRRNKKEKKKQVDFSYGIPVGPQTLKTRSNRLLLFLWAISAKSPTEFAGGLPATVTIILIKYVNAYSREITRNQVDVVVFLIHKNN